MFGRKRKRVVRLRYSQSLLSKVPGTKGAKLAHKKKIRALRRGEPVI